MTSYDTWDSYFWPDAPGVLKNKFGIKSYPDLAVAEAHAVAPRMRGIILDDHSALPETVDLDYYRRVHHRIFQDVYAWAGTTRVVPENAMAKQWRDVVNFDRLLREGVIGPDDMRVVDFASSPREAWEKIVCARCGSLLAPGGLKAGT